MFAVCKFPQTFVHGNWSIYRLFYPIKSQIFEANLKGEMSRLISWFRISVKELVKKDKFLLVSEIGLGVCALLFVLLLLRIFLN